MEYTNDSPNNLGLNFAETDDSPCFSTPFEPNEILSL